MTPIKTIIVDDDNLALEYLEGMIDWKSNGFEVIGKALDGGQGLLLYERLRPEVVISDVRMPVMNGIQMAEKILAQDRDCCIMLLSNFDEFAYVRDAMRAGIYDYILKSELNADALIEKLKWIKRHLEQVSNQFRCNLGQEVKALFNAPAPKSETPQMLLHQRYQYLVIQEHLPFEELLSFCHLVPQTMECGMVEVLARQTWADKGTMECAVHLERGRTALVLQREALASYRAESAVLTKWAEALRKALQEKGTQASVFILDALTGSTGAAEQYRGTKSAFTQYHFTGLSTVGSLHMQKIPAPTANPAEYGWAGLLAGRKERDYHLFVTAAVQVLRRMLSEGLADMDALRRAAPGWVTCEDFIGWAQRQGQGSSGHSQAVCQAVEYIRQNYALLDLSIQHIARHVALSRSRLSALFRTEMGKSIMDYLNDYRIDMAEHMIREGTYKIYEVSERVGYSSSQYFSKVFKKRKGKSPYQLVKDRRDV